jgi:hypothetical protein
LRTQTLPWRKNQGHLRHSLRVWLRVDWLVRGITLG